jgi:organic radical activating enzyme
MKNKINQLLDLFFFTPKPLPPGKINATIDIDGTPNRMHLRIEADGTGILIINASTVLHLNQTATEIAYYMLEDKDAEEIASSLTKRYRVSRETALQDYEELKIRINTLIKTPDLDPETFLDMERVDRHTLVSDIPLRLDCALTYQIPSGSSNLYAPTKRVDRDLDTEEWKKILSQAWEWGIPHVVFTGGEPTIRPDLNELIQYAEKLGQVTGLITDGNRLSNHDYFNELLNSGLDHLMIILNDIEETCWEGIRDAVTEDIHLTVHLTVNERVYGNIDKYLDKLVHIGVQNISISTPSKSDEDLLRNVRQLLSERGLTLIYDLPVPYSDLNPVNLEREEDQSSLPGSARSWLYVEPDGDVLPAQGYPTTLGNFLTDGWMTISTNRKMYIAD